MIRWLNKGVGLAELPDLQVSVSNHSRGHRGFAGSAQGKLGQQGRQKKELMEELVGCWQSIGMSCGTQSLAPCGHSKKLGMSPVENEGVY